jgi:3-phytase
MKKLSLLSLLLFLSQSLLANNLTTVHTLTANVETTPLPTGHEESDDAVIWVNPKDDSKSLVLGVSKAKQKHGGQAGLGVYDLTGKEVQYFQHDRLNNVDLRYNVMGYVIATGSNRDKNAISVFSVNENGVKLLDDLPTGITEEPYGLCMQQNPITRKTYVWLPMKSGMLYQYELKYQLHRNGFKAKLVNSFDTSKFLTKAQDQRLIDLIIEDVFLDPDILEDELLEELQKETSGRHQLEGCVSDDENGTLYVGMENFGVIRMDLINETKLKTSPKTILEVERTKFTPNLKSAVWKRSRSVNDIEGITLYKAKPKSKGALIISVQGLNEFAVLDRITNKYLGSFEVGFGNDPITETDGLTISSSPMGQYSSGLMVLHDHHNTDNNGNILKANYKYVDASKFLTFWPEYTP